MLKEFDVLLGAGYENWKWQPRVPRSNRNEKNFKSVGRGEEFFSFLPDFFRKKSRVITGSNHSSGSHEGLDTALVKRNRSAPLSFFGKNLFSLVIYIVP